MNKTDNEQFENILVLTDIVEADLMEKLLSEEDLPFYIRPWRDVNFDGIFAEQKGFGWLMGRIADEKQIRTIFDERIGRKESD
ncbi:MAG: hypothetical protein DRP60_14805 [Spirochaetes bacterium]|nr:MAG: hypothetical protein DRP60_14805 [Spirochaetota bacterium]